MTLNFGIVVDCASFLKDEGDDEIDLNNIFKEYIFKIKSSIVEYAMNKVLKCNNDSKKLNNDYCEEDTAVLHFVSTNDDGRKLDDDEVVDSQQPDDVIEENVMDRNEYESLYLVLLDLMVIIFYLSSLSDRESEDDEGSGDSDSNNNGGRSNNSDSKSYYCNEEYKRLFHDSDGRFTIPLPNELNDVMIRIRNNNLFIKDYVKNILKEVISGIEV